MGFRGFCAGVLLALAALGAAPAAAQQIKPLDVEQDPNGVDLLAGNVRMRMPELGVPGSGNLRLSNLNDIFPYLSGSLTPNTYGEATYDVNGGRATSDHFDCDAQSDCRSKNKNGSQMIDDPWSKVFIYSEGGTGTYIRFDLQNGPQVDITSGNGISFYASFVQYANGEKLTFNYHAETTSGGWVWRRPTSIVSNLGYTVTFDYAAATYGQAGWSTVTQATLYKSSDMATPLQRLTYSGNTITDLAGRQFTCTNCVNGLAAQSTGTSTTLRLPGEATDSFAAQGATCPTGGGKALVSNVTVEGVAYNYSWTASDSWCEYITKVQVSAPASFARTVNVYSGYNIRPRITSVVDSLNRTTSYQYDSAVRVNRVTYPEGNAASVVYDALGNITESRRIAKPGSGLSDLVETAYYASSTNEFCFGATCFKPAWTRDALNRQTDYTWASHGGMLTKTEPADNDGRRRRTTIEYETVNGVTRPIRERICFVNTSGASLTCGTANEQVKQTAYWGNTLLPASETLTDGASTQSLTTTYTYDNAGRVLIKDGPLAGTDDAAYFRYDTAGRKTWEIGLRGADGYRAATRTTYRDADEQPIKVETGVVVNPTDTLITVLGEQRHIYDTRRLKVRTTVAAGGTDQGVTQFSYDPRNRQECTAVRMNPAAWGSLPASACTLGTQGSAGPDRITKTIYDAENRVTTIQQAVGTAIQQNYAAFTYTTNGQRYSVTDANGNRAEMRYDGHDRQTHWYFPSKTSVGSINTADYEQYGYDAAGNRTSLRRRDGSTLTFQYDALNRIIMKVVPSRSGLSTTHTRDVYYGYDVGDRQLYARFDAHSGEGVSQTYDSFGRLKSLTLAMDGVTRTLNYTRDAGGRRTELTWPDALKTSFTYDAAGRTLSIREGATGSTNTLWSYSWSDYGRRVRRTARYGQYAEAQADGLGRMTSLTTDLSSTTHDNTTSFLYNPASQIGSRTLSNNAYAWTNHVDVDRPYAVNGLNQYTTAGPASFTYDANGNLTGDGSSSYVYDVENRLVSASGATTAQLRYDPLGRLYETSGGSAGTTRFLYDGDELVAEYNGTGTLLRRFVHGAAVDDPVVWYEGSGYADPRWLTADHQGSIVGISRSSSTLGINSYDPYGIPATANLGRFQYTGQAWIPELKMYHYKARIYSPTLGRFLQTDPIGYEDQINLYTYVGNDPVNLVDPEGTRATAAGNIIYIVPETAGVPRVTIPNTVGARGFRPGGDFHTYMVPQRTSLRDGRAIGAAFRSNPTPGQDRPASSNGTRNNVGGLVPWDGGTNYVRSFVIASPDPRRYTDIIVNYTIRGEHALNEGFVMGYGERNREGTYTLRHYGEGNAALQAPLLRFLWGPEVERAWRAVQQQISNQAGGRQPCNHGRAGSCGGSLEVWN